MASEQPTKRSQSIYEFQHALFTFTCFTGTIALVPAVPILKKPLGSVFDALCGGSGVTAMHK